MGMNAAGSREINVTPLIDVLLVLLIIFIVMMPIMLRSESLELPPRMSNVEPPGPTVAVKLEADLSVSIDDGPRMAFQELAPRLRTQLTKVDAVFVDFGDGAPWSGVIATVDTIRGVANDVHPGVVVAARLRGE
jgi:biopolymer transport protein ExbD